jgi:glycogen debranching enzyme
LLTRRYHGLLIAALDPAGAAGGPRTCLGARTLLVSKFDETLHYDGRSYELGANCWASGGPNPTIAPEGFRFIARFQLQGTTPVWTFACADALLEKRIWMADGSNTTYVRYDLVRGSAGPAQLEIKVLVNYRDFHSTTHMAQLDASARFQITTVEHGLRVLAGPGATPFYLLCDSAEAEPQHEWYLNFDLAEERFRGLDDREDQLLAGVFRARLELGGSLTMVLSTDAGASLDGRAALATRAQLDEKLLEYWVAAQPRSSLDASPWIRQLVLAAAQFPIRTPPGQATVSANREEAAQNASGVKISPESDLAGAVAGVTDSVIAGYPWFGAWGRDTMIALPGLLLETGRRDLARAILRSAANFVDQGMLPNVFAEAGQPPQYNSVDASLWYFDALRQYYDATSDRTLLQEIFATLEEIIKHYAHGTRYSIRMDEADGLLHAGESGIQLTWMDAKVGGQVMTPRIGKPIEVNALWYNALRTMARFAFVLDKPTWEYNRLAERVLAGFARFWNANAQCCFDVLDGPGGGHDEAIRPNQIFAVSLPESPLAVEQRAAVVEICLRRLFTPYGLRTLDPADPRYIGHYGGGQAQRDAAYHQGTVWAWLMGPFVLAHLRVHHDSRLAFTFLDPIAHHLLARGLGTVSELFDGEPPFAAGGAIAQAWSVGEILRAWSACHSAAFAGKRLRAAR